MNRFEASTDIIRLQKITLASLKQKIWNEARADTDQLEDY